MNTQPFSPELDPLASLRSPLNQDLLKHVLSPLELEALHMAYQPFTYDLDGIRLMITQRDCSHLLTSSVIKLQYFTDVISRITHLVLEGSEPLRRFMESSLDDHALPPYLRNRLRGIECDHIYDLVTLGRWRVSRTRGIGKSALKTLDRLFLKQDAVHLFC